jgi:hypothetical protein
MRLVETDFEASRQQMLVTIENTGLVKRQNSSVADP